MKLFITNRNYLKIQLQGALVVESRVKPQGRFYILILSFLLFSLITYLIFTWAQLEVDYMWIQNILTVFTSIILEAIPFILLGSLVSALIQVYVSEKLIAKFIPKNRFLGLLGASLMGFIFPVCECAIIPITRRLIKKGVPLGIGITFMLAVPAVNPIVLLSTYYAFSDKPIIVVLRGIFGILAAVTIGFLITIGERNKISPLKENGSYMEQGCYCGCDSGNILNEYLPKYKVILEHTTREFLSISKYLIFGAFISSVFQTVISRDLISSIGHKPMTSIVVMMCLAFLLSICSEADAFIARTFMTQFTTGSVLAFLIFGPMLDLKNAFMMFGSFRNKIVFRLITYIVLITLIIAAYINIIAVVGVIK